MAGYTLVSEDTCILSYSTHVSYPKRIRIGYHGIRRYTHTRHTPTDIRTHLHTHLHTEIRIRQRIRGRIRAILVRDTRLTLTHMDTSRDTRDTGTGYAVRDTGYAIRTLTLRNTLRIRSGYALRMRRRGGCAWDGLARQAPQPPCASRLWPWPLSTSRVLHSSSPAQPQPPQPPP